MKVIFLNCMSMDLVRDVLGHLLEQLDCKTKLTTKNMWSLAISHVNKSPLPVLLILDEVDELLSSSDMENVYKLLEWPHQTSNLLTIGERKHDRRGFSSLESSRAIAGIANSLDLTDRLLPRLQLKPEHKPYLLRFSPYNREQMLSIVNDRYGETLVLHRSPRSFQSRLDRAVRSQCIDPMRQQSRLDHGRSAHCFRRLPVSRDHSRRRQRGLLHRRHSSQSMELTTDSVATANVGVAQMMEVFTNSSQNTNSSDHVQTKSLPTFEKLLLCSLIVCMRASKKRVCTRAKVRFVRLPHRERR